MERAGNTVNLINRANGMSGEVYVHHDGITGATYIEHADLLKWSVAAGCEREVREMWVSRDRRVKAFIGFTDDGDPNDLLIFKNPTGEEQAKLDDRVAFKAIRLPKVVSYDEPNKITRKTKSNVRALRKHS